MAELEVVHLVVEGDFVHFLVELEVVTVEVALLVVVQ